MIAAVAENNALGKNNDLLWHLPNDFKRFKEITSGHHIIMGRKTFESFPKPLPNRTHVIISRQKDFSKEGCIVVKDLENALSTHLRQFMLELGNGFSFVARQKRLVIEDDEFFADLVFYNRLLRGFVVIELKTQKMTHQDLGQLQMYVNYYDRFEKLPDEKPTIGILLCQTKNAVMVELTLPKDTSIYATKYSLYLPEKKLLEEKLTKWTAEFGKDKNEEI